MKILKTSAFCVLLTVCYLQTSAQNEKIPLNEPDYNKPKLFADLPEKLNINVVALDALFGHSTGRQIEVSLTPQFNFQGIVVSKSPEEITQSTSIVIKSTNRPGATFTFTKAVDPKGGFKYIGRIISFQHIDAYEIAMENGEYILKKQTLYDLFNE